MKLPHITLRSVVVWVMALTLVFSSALPVFGEVPGEVSFDPYSDEEELEDYLDEEEYGEAPGWHTENGKTYYIDSDYCLAIGPTKIGGKWYLFDKDGYQDKRSGQVTHFGEKWYLSKGIICTGLKKIKGSLYYFDKTSYYVEVKGHYISAYGMRGDCGIYKNYVISYTGKLYKMPKKKKDKKCKKMARLIAKCSGKYAKGMSGMEKAQRAAFIIGSFYGRCKYSTKAKNYNKPYGVFYSKKCSCAGTASATVLVLKKLGFKKVKHKNKGKWKHQWATFKYKGKTCWADGMIGMAGYGKSPF